MKKVYLNTLTTEEVIKRLKDGEVIHIEESTGTIKMIDSVIVKNYKSTTTFNCSIVVDDTDDVYFEEEKFEITETGLYKTRNGTRVFVACIDDSFQFPVVGSIEGCLCHKYWMSNGKFCTNNEPEYNIVAKWED